MNKPVPFKGKVAHNHDPATAVKLVRMQTIPTPPTQTWIKQTVGTRLLTNVFSATTEPSGKPVFVVNKQFVSYRPGKKHPVVTYCCNEISYTAKIS
ncbi:hypothetical protein [Flavihumibacter profundi]|uniref:hypothetical protein n=1 Tax=Flavihumibacter profundi TaxID=2716883 RepID=UPI001CC419EF|nr:hypothetical protein [Flavihumibacter profundi]MBZ5855763.1 hypothetical protein [Flavihumibacter profundi]